MKRSHAILPIMIVQLLLFVFMMLTACEDETPGLQRENSREKLFFNGEIYTVNSAQTWASAIYVKEGIITYVGDDEGGKALASADAEMIDLKGVFMMPGIHDVHVHPLEAATENFQFILNDNIENPEDYARDIADAMEDNPGNGWLLGWGHWINVPLSATRLPKEILDDEAPNRPVAIMEQTSHSVWCNSKALELMGIDANTPNPPGGIIMRDENGEANGLLIDNAGNLLLDLALAASSEGAQKDYNGLVNVALPELAKHGITSICDARTYWKREHHKSWQKVAEEGKLTARVNLGLWAYPTENDLSQIAALNALYSDDPNSLLKINQIKLYADGIIHNTTSAMHDDYLIDYFGLPTNNGLNYFDQQRMSAYIAALESSGFDFHIHAIGNRGVHEALNAIEESGSSQGRHRLTHIEYVDPADYGRFAQLNVTADAQVAGDFTQPDQWHDNDYLIGAALNQNNIPLKSLYQAQARISLSSDWDVSSLNPFIGIQHAVNREPQALSLEEAVKAYTLNAAYVMRQEAKVGSLEVGKEADLIILNKNIFDISANSIGSVKVDETYLQGRRIYER
ncbi:MAG: amidohydrolase family protein [Bacteroidia bacterium]|nr:amidohydrolase family protein [Bacteroidia bacterium]